MNVDRRVAGLAVLVLAVVSLVVLAGAADSAIKGAAMPLPLVPPPSNGSCLSEAGPTRTEVPCTESHTAQIVFARAVWKTRAAERFALDLKQPCWAAGSEALEPWGLSRPDPYSGVVPGSDWGPVALIVDTDVVAGTEALNSASWVACVLRPRIAATPGVNDPLTAPSVFAGSIETLMPMSARPVGLRSCYAATDLLPATVSCRALHRGEILAVQLSPGTAEDPADAEFEADSCAEIAAELLLTADPTFAGKLRTRVITHPAGTQIAGQAGHGLTGLVQRCVVEPTDGLFRDSVIGIGSKELPIQ